MCYPGGLRGVRNDLAGTFDLASLVDCSEAGRRRPRHHGMAAKMEDFAFLFLSARPSPLRMFQHYNCNKHLVDGRSFRNLVYKASRHYWSKIGREEVNAAVQNRLPCPYSARPWRKKEEGWEALGDLISLGSLFDMMCFLMTEVRSEKAGRWVLVWILGFFDSMLG